MAAEEEKAAWRHPLLGAVIWLLGGYAPPALKSIGSNASSFNDNSSNSLKENNSNNALEGCWERDSPSLSNTQSSTPLNDGISRLTPKVLQKKVAGRSPSVSPDGSPFGWFVSTGTTPSQTTPHAMQH